MILANRESVVHKTKIVFAFSRNTFMGQTRMALTQIAHQAFATIVGVAGIDSYLVFPTIDVFGGEDGYEHRNRITITAASTDAAALAKFEQVALGLLNSDANFQRFTG